MTTDTKYRAQVLAYDGKRWVDGGLFGSRRDAEKDAARLAAKYDQPTRIIEL